MDNGLEWLPHPGAQPVKLPPIPSQSGVDSSSGSGKPLSWKTLSKWLKGRDTVMNIEIAPEELEAYTKRWALKWHYFQETFPETSQDDADGMGRDEMRARITWLEGEFSRIAERIHNLPDDTADYEILAGSLFVANLIENCRPDLARVLTTSKTVGDDSTTRDGAGLGTAIAQVCHNSDYFDGHRPPQQLKTVEKSHMFALRCVNEIITMKQTLAARSKILHGDLSSPIENGSRSSKSVGSPVASAVEASEPGDGPDQSIHLHSMGRQLPTTATGPIAGSDPITLRSVLPDLRNPRPRVTNANRRNEPATLVSSANSHMKNLTALLGIAFFGASITWSTIFSGTRGNVVLISWAACLFIVGAVGAAGASILVMPDEDIVAKHLTVRWTVRIPSLLAMIHVLAGMFLVAIAILVLDPANGNLDLRGGQRGTQSAGGYAISVSAVFLIVVGIVWRWYTQHTCWMVQEPTGVGTPRATGDCRPSFSSKVPRLCWDTPGGPIRLLGLLTDTTLSFDNPGRIGGEQQSTFRPGFLSFGPNVTIILAQWPSLQHIQPKPKYKL
ncbi:hypothetical protein B0H11DRAFT_2195488 [Mycena galericulata]|nr:hypothetical protein B0H11DRAFT_2195488 [Mycena galericulata]